MSTEEYPGVIAIDFGTTHIRVAALDNKELNFTIPSCVAFTEDGILVGQDALEQRAKDPAQTILGIKRYLGRHPEHPLVKRESPIRLIGKQDATIMVVEYKGNQVEISPQGIVCIILG
ncbi:hypothetical protein DSO57_1019469 [Entomophthora muscae]|uniref:Uncharacterized protein n=1 Tax=Entomophthora muscae TaxID=34485 RepID=A0ACC2SGX3_9FUNG|nr:hypothetical protein DSO57_1019469 [Entomophthora muscae]